MKNINLDIISSMPKEETINKLHLEDLPFITGLGSSENTSPMMGRQVAIHTSISTHEGQSNQVDNYE